MKNNTDAMLDIQVEVIEIENAMLTVKYSEDVNAKDSAFDLIKAKFNKVNEIINESLK